MAVPDAPINLTFVDNTVMWDPSAGATSYNLYYLKDKCPNCYFTSLDDWTVVKNVGTESATINDGKLLLDVPSVASNTVTCNYIYNLLLEDFEITIDLVSYLADDSTKGVRSYLKIKSVDGLDSVYIRYKINTAGTEHDITSELRLNGNIQVLTDVETSRPSKLRIIRIGNIFYTYYYISSWVLIDSRDFSTRADNIINVQCLLSVNTDYGGSVEFDNLIITPSVFDSGTTITGITDTRYTFTGLTIDDFYCIEITAVNDDGESDPSDEIYGTIEETTGHYSLEEISLLSAKEIIGLYTLQEIDELYTLDMTDVTVSTAEMDELQKAKEITDLHSMVTLQEH